jgi:Uma2 family endonuclease
MATVTKPTLLTAEQFYDWANRPENRDRPCELERGRIVEMSRPGMLHGMVCANVARILGNYAVARQRGYVCSNDTGVIVERGPDTVRGPEVLFFEDADDVEDVDPHYSETPALLAVEVLSPNDTAGKVARRVNEQLRFGTRLIWVLDPDARNVIVHRADAREEVVEETEVLTGNGILADFRCRVAEFFALPGKQRSESSHERPPRKPGGQRRHPRKGRSEPRP